MAVRLSKVFRGSSQTWLTKQANDDLAQFHTSRIKFKRLELSVGLSS
jgi:plasmid maintenance system antidote protein VapI